MDLRDRRYWPELKEQFLAAAAYLLSVFEGLNFMLAIHRFPGQEASGALVIVLALCGMGSMIAGSRKIERLFCFSAAAVCLLHAIVMRLIMSCTPNEFQFVVMLALPIALMLHVLDIEEDL